MQIVTLTTDFGISDWFVGSLKGIIASNAPNAQVVDITHRIPHHDVKAGAFALMAAAKYFPEGTVHMAVIDPGVGSERSAIAASVRGQYFVGPDNGLLSWAIGPAGADEIFQIDNPEIILEETSTTFHGRDIFAPAAAHLAAGGEIAKLGSRRADMIALLWPPVMSCTDGSLKGAVVYIDRFGNAITNLENVVARAMLTPRVHLDDGNWMTVADYYQSVPEGELVAVCGSTGYLEIARNSGNAAESLGIRPGSELLLSPGKQ